MKFSFNTKINYFEIDSYSRLKIGCLSKLLQEAAICHSDKVGKGIDTLREKGFAWNLYKLSIHFNRYPEYNENIKINTWVRGIKGFKIYRDFEVFADNEKLAIASSAWLYIDLNMKKIIRIPDEMGEAYTVENDSVFDEDIDKWKANENFTSDNDISVTTRFSDYDPNGHVNNAVYLDYLQTLVSNLLFDKEQINMIKIQYNKGIDKNTKIIKTGYKNSESKYYFKIFDDNNIYARGEFL